MAIALIYGYQLRSNETESAHTPGSTLTPQHAQTASIVGQHAPVFELTDLDGRSRTSSEWSQRAQVINFWANWCEPCVRELPLLQTLSQQPQYRDIAFVTISIDDFETRRRFAETHQLELLVLGGGAQAIAVAEAYGNTLGLLPYTVFVTPDQKIDSIHIGELNKTALTDTLSTLQ